MNQEQSSKTPVTVLKKQTNWEKLYFYQKTVVLYQMTYVFCRRFLPRHGDRTVDQMIQAARSGKQNIVEGFADRMMATHLKKKETDFTENGGIRERMTAARLGRRKTQNEEIAALKAENASLRRELAQLKAQFVVPSPVPHYQKPV